MPTHVLHRNEGIGDQVVSGFDQLDNAHAKDPCSEESIQRMRQVSSYLKPCPPAFGYVSGDRLDLYPRWVQFRRSFLLDLSGRWMSPNGEVVGPDVFIPIAEQAGLIQRIERVLELVAHDAADLFHHHPDFCSSINLSPSDLHSRRTIEFLKELSAILFLMQSSTAIRSKPQRSKLGPGYSSLSYLESFELDLLDGTGVFVEMRSTRALFCFGLAWYQGMTSGHAATSPKIELGCQPLRGVYAVPAGAELSCS